ncbi:MAG: hypothetical protein ACQ9MH_07770 [Nitrospinales bacterium]
MMSNFTKTPMKLGVVLTILVGAFALINFVPVDSVNAARDCRVDAVEGGACSAGDETCIRSYCADLNFLKMQGFFDNKLIDENKEEQNEANKGDINNPDPDCLATGSTSSMSFAQRGMCNSSSSSSSYF